MAEEVKTTGEAAPVQIWTIQLARWRVAKAQDIPLLNITAKTGVRAFAPDFQYVMDYKQGRLTQAQYTDLYLERMEKSKKLFPERWESLKEYERVALACYCPAGRFCHRHLFSTLMQDYLKDQGLVSQPMGELQWHE